METKSAVLGAAGMLLAGGLAFGLVGIANAENTPAPAPPVTTSAPAATAAPEPAPEPAVTTEAPEPTAEPVAPVIMEPVPVIEPAPVYVAPQPVYVAPAPAPDPVVEPAPATQAPLYKGADGYYYAPDIPNGGTGPKIGHAG